MPTKYIFENGVMKLNPAYLAATNQTTTVANPSEALAVLSSTTDVMELQEKNNYQVTMSDASISSMEMMMGDVGFAQAFNASSIDSNQVMDDLTRTFARYEIPIGMINKLLALMEYKMKFRLDNSASMNEPTEVIRKNAISDELKNRFKANNSGERTMTRWLELEDLLHVYMDILAYIPTKPITLTFLNGTQTIQLTHDNMTPDQFKANAHQKISDAFARGAAGCTPAYDRLNADFQAASTDKTMIFFGGDGDDDNHSDSDMVNLITNRNNPENCPLTLLMCNKNKVAWMDKADKAERRDGQENLVNTMDDFKSEREQVLNAQGPVVPYNQGWYIIAGLVGCINPHDLDALDENLPFTKFTIDNLMGYVIPEMDYRRYWAKNMNANLLVPDLYSQFANERVFASNIVSKAELKMREDRAGYVDGERPAVAPSRSGVGSSSFSFMPPPAPTGSKYYNNSSSTHGYNKPF